MAEKDNFLKGVVEGFYGRSWTWESRQDYAGYLSVLGLNTYLYCPKSDACLRKRWREDWTDGDFAALASMGGAFTARDIYWGVGLSPFELYLDYGKQQREQLYAKVQRLQELGAPLLAILFDDMPGGMDELAERQAQIVNDIQSWTPEQRLLVCPTYYSFDPLLEKHFGRKPDDYWQEFGAAISTDVDIFWTGNAVCSQQISRADIDAITGALGRPVTLWDNYPVNDGAERSNHLYTSPLHDRSREMRPGLRGHLCNPMNQAVTSVPALAGLAQLYSDASLDPAVVRRIVGEEVMQQLALDGRRFERQGLSAISQDQRESLAAEYEALPGKAAVEISDWLRGEYRFDPDCLTG